MQIEKKEKDRRESQEMVVATKTRATLIQTITQANKWSSSLFLNAVYFSSVTFS